jgi:hypothetical protein
MGSRDGRRGLADLVTATTRPRWAAQLATWAATALWAVAAYLVFVGVMFAWYAHQGVAGTPPWWWVAVGVTAVTAFSAVGFAIGAYWASRFAAPVAAFGGFLVMFLSVQTGFSHSSGWALILPTNSNGSFDGSAQTDAGIFYPWLPDLPIARILFLAGIAVAALGLTGLPARAGGPWLRRAAALVTLAGVALAGSSHPSVLRLQLGLLNTPGPCGGCAGPVATTSYEAQMQLLFAHAFVGAGSGTGSPVQQAVQAALLRAAGIPFAAQPGLIAGTENFPESGPGAATGPVYAAAQRLAAGPAAARHDWLAAHLAALRAGRLTLQDLP